MNVTLPKLLILIGNILYAIGLLFLTYAHRYNSRVMGKAALGIAIIAPNENSPQWKEKEKIRKISDTLFYIGMVLSCMGIALQIIVVLIA